MDAVFDESTSASLLMKIKDYEDEKAWEEFFKKYLPRIHAVCRQAGLSPTEVDEVAACVLLSLARSMKDFRYDPKKKFRSWLDRVVRNKIRDSWRDSQRRPGDRGSGDSAVQDKLLQEPARLESLLAELNTGLEESLQRLHQAMEIVQKKYKESQSWEAFWLRHHHELSVKEIAVQLAMTKGAVCSAIHRVKHDVKEVVRHLERLEQPQV